MHWALQCCVEAMIYGHGLMVSCRDSPLDQTSKDNSDSRKSTLSVHTPAFIPSSHFIPLPVDLDTVDDYTVDCALDRRRCEIQACISIDYFSV